MTTNKIFSQRSFIAFLVGLSIILAATPIGKKMKKLPYFDRVGLWLTIDGAK